MKRREANPISLNTVLELNEALRGVVTQGTGGAAAVVPNSFGKTGTTSDRRDAWFVGYTSELVSAVWLAKPQRTKTGALAYLPMEGTSGGHAAAPLWARFMERAVPLQRQFNRVHGAPRW